MQFDHMKFLFFAANSCFILRALPVSKGPPVVIDRESLFCPLYLPNTQQRIDSVVNNYSVIFQKNQEIFIIRPIFCLLHQSCCTYIAVCVAAGG